MPEEIQTYPYRGCTVELLGVTSVAGVDHYHVRCPAQLNADDVADALGLSNFDDHALEGRVRTGPTITARLYRVEPPEHEPWDGFSSDAEADADALASAGFGTDEDYGGARDEW